MNASPSRWAGVAGAGDGRRQPRGIEGLPPWNGTGRFAIGTLSVLAVLAIGYVAAPRVRAQAAPGQGEPPKDSAPAPRTFPKDSAPVPAPPDIPKDSTRAPAPPDIPKDSPPQQQPRERPQSSGAAPADEPAGSTAVPLSARYRFIERYSPEEDPQRPDAITQYRVAVSQTVKETWEKAQGAPDVRQSSHTTIYTERAAKVARDGEVTETIRRYDDVRAKLMAPAPPQNPPFLQGLEIWYHRRPGDRPEIVSLSRNRPLRAEEYDSIADDLVFVPQLAALFRQIPRRVGDTWQIPPLVTKLMWGKAPEQDEYDLMGTLIDIRKARKGNSLEAIVGVSGGFIMDDVPNKFNARIYFTFEPTASLTGPDRPAASPAVADSGAQTRVPRRDEGIIEARGWVSEAQMAQTYSAVIPDTDDRLKYTITVELRMWRERLPVTPSPLSSRTVASLTVPSPAPTANEANSWLVYDDPKGRFHLRHSQRLQRNTSEVDPNVFALVDRKIGDGRDVFILRLPPGAADPQGEHRFRDAEQFRREIEADWAKRKLELLQGSTGWLPEADWAPLKVFRKEFGVKLAGQDEKGKTVDRLYIDDYLVLSGRSDCVHIESMTNRNDHTTFRNEVERIIKSLQFSDAGERASANPATPARSAPPPRP
jgi:hypothetical protein